MKQIPLSANPKTHIQSSVELTVFNRSIREEIASDYILPDTYPDISSILRVTARPVLIGRFISGRRLEFNGAVDYAVLFCADTEDGETLHCVHFQGEWNSSVNDIEGLDRSDICILPSASCTAKPANPRKVSLRTVIESAVSVTTPVSCSVKCEGAASVEEELALEKQTEIFSSGKVRTFIPEPLRISEDLEADASAPAIDEIISCTADIFFHEARPIKDDKRIDVAMKGTAAVNCLYKALGDAGTYRSLSRKLPVVHTLSADEFAETFISCPQDGMTACVSAVPIEINAAAAENNYGERRVIELDMTAELTVRLFGNEEAELTLDAYSVNRDGECEFEDTELSAPTRVFATNFSVGENLSREELKIPENAVFTDICADASADSVAVGGGRGIIVGTALLSCVFINSDGKAGSADASVPLRFEISTGELSEPFASTVTMNVTDIRARIDGERVYFDFEVSLNLTLTEKCRRHTVRLIRLSGDTRTNTADASMTLYYPAPDETLWEIAKRYRTTVDAIRAVNKENARVLLIPCGIPEGFILK